VKEEQAAAIEAATAMILRAIGEDPDRPGLVDTPRRVANWWAEFASYQDDNLDTTFPAHRVDQLVMVTGVRVWSLCEHHLLPFYCDLSMAYIIREQVLGLSKFGRIAHQHAHRLQTQESLVDHVALGLRAATKSEDVAVVARGEHLCMTMRGIKTPATMVSSSLHGQFRHDAAARAEFLSLAGLT